MGGTIRIKLRQAMAGRITKRKLVELDHGVFLPMASLSNATHIIRGLAAITQSWSVKFGKFRLREFRKFQLREFKLCNPWSTQNTARAPDDSSFQSQGWMSDLLVIKMPWIESSQETPLIPL